MPKIFKSTKAYLLTATILSSSMLSGCIENLDSGLALGAGIDLIKSVTVDESEVKSLSRLSASNLDIQNNVAGPSSHYTQRLNQLFANHQHEDGLDLNYKVYLGDEFNAFAMPDGTVRVYSGLMDQLSDEELIAVIGHEIGHVKLNHSLNAYKSAYVTSGLRKGVAAIGGTAGDIAASQLGGLGEKFINSQFSQSQELGADKYGMSFMKKHGYNPLALVTAFQKMKAIAGEGGGLLSTHPATSKRIEQMQELL